VGVRFRAFSSWIFGLFSRKTNRKRKRKKRPPDFQGWLSEEFSHISQPEWA
jgi:hypothetical protein